MYFALASSRLETLHGGLADAIRWQVIAARREETYDRKPDEEFDTRIEVMSRLSEEEATKVFGKRMDISGGNARRVMVEGTQLEESKPDESSIPWIEEFSFRSII